MSQLKVNSIVPVGGLPSGANGGIIQCIQTFKNDATSTTSNTFVDLAGMSATITPSSNSNKILVRFSLCLSTSATALIIVNLLRGSTNIAQPSTTPTRHGTVIAYVAEGSQMMQGYEFLDSPATTSATTYKLQWRNHLAGYTSKLNEYFSVSDGDYAATSTMTLMEVTV
tara:strand:+ start:301 stop:807 length:507 start_codon:yes stop_codon:yes gene_type:complete